MSDAEQNTVDNVGRRGPGTRQRFAALLIGAALVVIALAASIAIAIPVVFAIPDIESSSFLLASLIVTEVAFLALDSSISCGVLAGTRSRSASRPEVSLSG